MCKRDGREGEGERQIKGYGREEQTEQIGGRVKDERLIVFCFNEDLY